MRFCFSAVFLVKQILLEVGIGGFESVTCVRQLSIKLGSNRSFANCVREIIQLREQAVHGIVSRAWGAVVVAVFNVEVREIP